MKKVSNVLLKTSPVNSMSQSIYEYDDNHYIASYLRYTRSTEYWGNRNIHTWRLVWVVVNKQDLKPLVGGTSRKETIETFKKYYGEN